MDKVIPKAMKTYVREYEERQRERNRPRNRSVIYTFSQDIVLFDVYNFRDT